MADAPKPFADDQVWHPSMARPMTPQVEDSIEHILTNCRHALERWRDSRSLDEERGRTAEYIAAVALLEEAAYARRE